MVQTCDVSDTTTDGSLPPVPCLCTRMQHIQCTFPHHYVRYSLSCINASALMSDPLRDVKILEMFPMHDESELNVLEVHIGIGTVAASAALLLSCSEAQTHCCDVRCGGSVAEEYAAFFPLLSLSKRFATTMARRSLSTSHSQVRDPHPMQLLARLPCRAL